MVALGRTVVGGRLEARLRNILRTLKVASGDFGLGPRESANRGSRFPTHRMRNCVKKVTPLDGWTAVRLQKRGRHIPSVSDAARPEGSSKHLQLRGVRGEQAR